MNCDESEFSLLHVNEGGIKKNITVKWLKMTKWIDFKKQQPNKDIGFCWVMNSKRGSYGYVAIWYDDNKYFLLSKPLDGDSPALDVTHWYPLPFPEYGYQDE